MLWLKEERWLSMDDASIQSLTTRIENTLVLTKSSVGLGSVDDTSDAGKPVSAEQQAALDLKADLASPTFTGTVTLPVGLTGLVRSDSGVVSIESDVSALVTAIKIVETAGTPVTQRTTMNFTGAGVSVEDTGGKTTVTINGGVGGALALSQRAPAGTETVPSDNCAVVSFDYLIADGFELVLESGADFIVL